MLKFNDYLKEAALSAKQKKIAAVAGDKDKIDAADLAALRNGKKPVEEASCSGKDMKKEELVGNQHKLDKNKNGKLDAHDFKLLRKEESEQIDELSKKTMGSYAHKATDDAQDKAHDAYDSGTPTRHELEVQGGKNNDGKYGHKPLQNRLTGLARASKKLGDKGIGKDVEKSVSHHLKQRYHYDNMDDGKAARSDDAALRQSSKAHEKIQKASGVKEEVEINEGKMKDIYTDMMHHATKKGYSSHKEFTSADYDTVGKQHGISGKDLAIVAGHKTAQQADTHFKKPVEPGKGMDRAKALAQRGMQSLSKEEVERIEEKLTQIDELSKKTLGSYVNKAAKDSRIHGQIATDFENTADKARKQSKKDSFERLNRKYLEKSWKREDGIAKAVGKLTKEEVELEEATTRKDFQMVADLIKGHESADKRKELATHHAGIFAKQNPRFDHAKFMKAAGVNEEVQQEVSPYLKATLKVMDEGKIDNLRDAQKLRQDTQSAYDKNYKPDTSHPHIQVVKGNAYGGANQKDDEGDEKPDETKEKKGRGRPTGSKSGARQKGGGHEDGGIPVHNLNLPKSYKQIKIKE